VRATLDALKKQVSPKLVASRRGKKIADIIARRGDISARVAEADADAQVA
jgi:small subunit ribosomal protein S5